MNLRQELSSHNEKIWVLCLPENSGSETRPLSPLPDLVDWYNNQILTKALLTKKIRLQLGEKTLIPTCGLTGAEKILVVGLGDGAALGAAQGRQIVQDLSQTLEQLQENQAWIIFSSNLPPKFIDEIKKSRTSSGPWGQATISVG